jgi:hypothetical protein
MSRTSIFYKNQSKTVPISVREMDCLLQRVTEGKIQGGIEVTGRQGSYWMTLRKGEDTLI